MFLAFGHQWKAGFMLTVSCALLCAATVEMSEKEINEMRERSAVLKRKVQLFQGLVKVRAYSLSTDCMKIQLQLVKLVTSLNEICSPLIAENVVAHQPLA